MSAGTPPITSAPPASTGMGGWGATAFGVGAAFSAIQGWMATEQASRQNTAMINAQAQAYKQMAEYGRSNLGRYDVLREFSEFESNSLGLQAISARRQAAAKSNDDIGAYRTAQADSGAAMSGSKARLHLNIDRLNNQNETNLRINIANAYMQQAMQYRERIFAQGQQNQQIVQQYQNQINAYNNQMVSAPIAGISGALSGISTGIGITSGIRGLST